MSQIGPRGVKICSGQVISDGQTEGRTERWTDHYRATAEQGPYFIN